MTRDYDDFIQEEAIQDSLFLAADREDYLRDLWKEEQMFTQLLIGEPVKGRIFTATKIEMHVRKRNISPLNRAVQKNSRSTNRLKSPLPF